MNINDREFKNIFPIELKQHSAKSLRSHKLNIINIGQILLVCFLFFILITQTFKLIFSDSSYIKQTDNLSVVDYSNIIKPEDIKVSEATEIIEINSDIIFTLGEYDGKLAILSPDGQTVYEVFNVYINTLPDYDKNLLLNGIKIKTADELHSLIEDYSS